MHCDVSFQFLRYDWSARAPRERINYVVCHLHTRAVNCDFDCLLLLRVHNECHVLQGMANDVIHEPRSVTSDGQGRWRLVLVFIRKDKDRHWPTGLMDLLDTMI